MTDDDLVTTIAHLYIEAFDKHRDRLKMCLHEDAVLNWFGRTLNGSDEIISFVNATLPSTIHYIHHAKVPSPPSIVTDVNNNIVSCDVTMRHVVDNEKHMVSKFEGSGSTCRESLKRPVEWENDPKDLNLINLLAGMEEVNIIHHRSKLTKFLKSTPQFNVNQIIVRPEERNGKKVKGIIIKANLYFQSKHQASKIWERKIDHIYLEYCDDYIITIVYKGASSCRRNLSKLFKDM